MAADVADICIDLIPCGGAERKSLDRRADILRNIRSVSIGYPSSHTVFDPFHSTPLPFRVCTNWHPALTPAYSVNGSTTGAGIFAPDLFANMAFTQDWVQNDWEIDPHVETAGFQGR